MQCRVYPSKIVLRGIAHSSGSIMSSLDCNHYPFLGIQLSGSHSHSLFLPFFFAGSWTLCHFQTYLNRLCPHQRSLPLIGIANFITTPSRITVSIQAEAVQPDPTLTRKLQRTKLPSNGFKNRTTELSRIANLVQTIHLRILVTSSPCTQKTLYV